MTRFIDAHFEALLFGLFWLDASVLAVLAGRPALAAVGLITVAPFLALYVVRSRDRARGG